MDKIQEYMRKADKTFELHKRILARQGYVLRELPGCSEPNYECVRKR